RVLFRSNTPTVDADHVYVVWQSNERATLEALTHAGKPVWTYDLGPFKGGHGPAGSPIVFEELVIFCNDHEGLSFLLGIDRITGRQRWKVARTGRRACYTTPCVFRSGGGVAQLIFTHSYQGITSVNPASGEKNWEIMPFGTFKQRAIGSPIVAGGLVIGSSGFTTAERNVVAVRPTSDGSVMSVSEVYRVTKYAPHIPTPLAYRGLMFLWDDRGIVVCAELETGKEVWVKRVGGTFYGSPICVDGKLYCADRNGNVVVLAASREYRLLGRNPLGEPTCATPAVANGVLYLRSDSHLFSIGG
ncbi:MAG: PQQ-binding-like beta-propeller repeat protein, partial [Pirellulales bacterium]